MHNVTLYSSEFSTHIHDKDIYYILQGHQAEFTSLYSSAEIFFGTHERRKKMKWLTRLLIAGDPNFHVETGNSSRWASWDHLMWGLWVTTVWLPIWFEFQGGPKSFSCSLNSVYTQKNTIKNLHSWFSFIFLVLSLSFSVITTI